MATTEERLAALEAKLAALTETTPTTYYEHQYSGEEIDAAVGRALTGGALDTSVTNVSNQLGTLVRPNLLDNWYFGRPVNQRGGKIIQQGVNIYTDSALKTLIGPADYACPVVELTSTYAKVRDAKNTSSYYYAAPADVVRGYTGNGYGVDRWITDINAGGAVLVGSNGIMLTAQGMYWGERLSNIADLSGKTMTASVLMSDGSIFYGTVVISWDLNVPQSFINNSFILMYANKIGDDLAQIEIATHTANVTILAAKLEIGPTQTLAHREGDRWVMNEVPEYGEQLRRCQRYHREIERSNYGTFAFGMSTSATEIDFLIPLNPPMRVAPSVSFEGSFATNGVSFNSISSLVVVKSYPDGIMLRATGSGFVRGEERTLQVSSAATSKIIISADL
nr:MAG TPA: hypothetical protein [Caudoviricetes sp.]